MIFAITAHEWTVNKMAEYIDRQAAIDALWKELFAYEDAQEKDAVDKGNEAIDEWFLKVRPCVQTVSDNGRMAILELPAADVEPVRHGRWEVFYAEELCGHRRAYYVCSNCCQNCGARMDGEQDG